MNEFIRAQNSQHVYSYPPKDIKELGDQPLQWSGLLGGGWGRGFGTVQDGKICISRDKETKEPVTVSKESDICFVCTKDERNFADLAKTITGFVSV